MADKKPTSFKLTIDFPLDCYDQLQESCDSQYWCEIRHTEKATFVREHHGEDKHPVPGPWIMLTQTRRKKGLVLMATLVPAAFGDTLCGGMDGSIGDLWLQCAVLGEIKYG